MPNFFKLLGELTTYVSGRKGIKNTLDFPEEKRHSSELPDAYNTLLEKMYENGG